MTKFLRLNPNDIVDVAVVDLKAGETYDGVTLLQDIPSGHKFALKPIKKGEDIIKYGAPIGHATEDIAVGGHIHTHNTATNLSGVLEYEYTPQFEKYEVPSKRPDLYMYKRDTGEYGIRNELWIIPTVGCIVGQLRLIAKRFEQLHAPYFEGFDGIQVFSHPFGCSQMGDDHINTKQALQNMTKHPNAGGVLVVGLGCENNQVAEFRDSYEYNKDRIKFLIMQDVMDEVEESVKLMTVLYEQMKNDKREKTELKNLRVGLKCGGSDGFSGITANPLQGRFSDYVTANGGTTVLTEVPEMFGAEKILMRRAQNEEVFNKTVDLINNFKEYYASHNQVIYDNPSPGNKAGGITTLEDKSLGCTQKAGLSNVQDVLGYTDRLKTNGLNLISAPGNDLVSVTTLGMAGCQLVMFSTGRGTPFGGFIPTIKISTNTPIYEKKPMWIDFNAGQLLQGVTMDQVLDKFIDFVIGVANGNKTLNEINDFREIALFKDGVIL